MEKQCDEVMRVAGAMMKVGHGLPASLWGTHALDGICTSANGVAVLFWQGPVALLPQYEQAAVRKMLREFRAQASSGVIAGEWPRDLTGSPCRECLGKGGRVDLMRNCEQCSGTGSCECPECEQALKCDECGGTGASDIPTGKSVYCDVCHGAGLVYESVEVAGTRIAGVYAHLFGKLPGIVPVVLNEGSTCLKDTLLFRFGGGCGLVMGIVG